MYSSCYYLHLSTAPVCISEQDIIHFIGQRDVTVCINVGVLTDHFENYGFEVSKFLVILTVLYVGTWHVMRSEFSCCLQSCVRCMYNFALTVTCV